MNLDLIITVALIVTAMGLAVLFGWLGARPLNLVKGPRLAPYRLLMLLSAVAVVFLSMRAMSLLQSGH